MDLGKIIELISNSTLQLRKDGYSQIITILKEENKKEEIFCLGNILSRILMSILNDLKETKEDISHSALKTLGYLIHSSSLVGSFSESEQNQILKELIQIIHQAPNKMLCNLAVWCLSVQNFPKASFVQPNILNDVLKSVVHAIETPFKSSTIELEAISVNFLFSFI